MGDLTDRKVQIDVADPTPLGLLGLAVVTGVASTQKLGITDGLSFVLPWAIFLGAVAQLIAAVYDFNHKNIFGANIFGAFGLFWLGVSLSWMMKMGLFGPELAAVDMGQLGTAFFIYFVFALAGTAIAAGLNKVLFIDMVVIDILLLGLALDATGLGGSWAHSMAAYAEAGISIITLYASCAVFINKFYGCSVLPMGQPLIRKA